MPTYQTIYLLKDPQGWQRQIQRRKKFQCSSVNVYIYIYIGCNALWLISYVHQYKDKDKDKDKVLKRPNMCYIFEKQRVRGYQIWHSQTASRPHPQRIQTASTPHCFSPFLILSDTVSPFLIVSHCSSLFLIVSRCLSPFLTVSHRFSSPPSPLSSSSPPSTFRECWGILGFPEFLEILFLGPTCQVHLV